MNITKRDFKMFALGFFTLLIIEIAYNWPDSVASFKAGYHSVR